MRWLWLTLLVCLLSGCAARGDKDLKRAAKLAANKPYAASEQLWPMLERSTGTQRDEIRFHIARSLLRLDMPMAAEDYLLGGVEAGPRSPFFEESARALIEVLEAHQDLQRLTPLVEEIPREQLPESIEPYILYLKGVAAHERGDHPLSRRLLDDVLPPVRPQAKFYQGVVFVEQGKLRSASGAFLDVHQASADGRVDASQTLQDAAIVNVARIYYSVERWEDAKKYYNMIGKKSVYWETALLEGGWTYFMSDALEPALSRVLTIQQDSTAWVPEATILESLIYYSAQAYQQAENTLFAFETEGNSLHFEMERLIERAQNDPGAAYAATQQESDSRDLPSVLRFLLARDRPFQAAQARIHQTDEELLAIEVAPERWRAAVGNQLAARLQEKRGTFVEEAGRRVVERLKGEAAYLNDLLAQGELIRFEIGEAERREVQEQIAAPQ